MSRQSLPTNLAIPVKAPPVGVAPNYTHPQSIAYQIFITGGVCTGLIISFYSCRAFASLSGMTKHNRWWKEVLFGFTVLLTLCYISVLIANDSYFGIFGIHEWNILLQNYEVKVPLVLSVIVACMYSIDLFCVKLCLLIFFIDVFGRLRWFRWACYAQIIVIGLFHFSAATVYVVVCAPHHSNTWIDYLMAFASLKCSQVSSLTVTQGVFNLTSDIILVVLPLPAIWSLNMPARKKMAVSVMFLTGLCAVVTSCLALYYRVLLTRGWSDASWWSVPASCTSVSEMTAGIVVLCMPAAASVFRKHKDSTPFKFSLSWPLTSRFIFSSGRGDRSWRHFFRSSPKTQSDWCIKCLEHSQYNTSDNSNSSQTHGPLHQQYAHQVSGGSFEA